MQEWDKIYAVFSRPLRANRHTEANHPHWSGAHLGATLLNDINVQRGDGGSGFGNAGLRCTICHFTSNSSKLHGQP